MPTSSINIAELRRRLIETGGVEYWRSLEELARTPDFRQAVLSEFPSLASVWPSGHSRRDLLKVMGASLALVGLSGCFRPPPASKVVPYVRPPEESVTGLPMYFASAMPFDGYGRGVLVQSREGRPIKIEGNPDHPASLGGTDVFMQASVLDLYDPDRSRNVKYAGMISRWGEFTTALRQRLEHHRGDGRGLRLLSGPCSSPTFAAQLGEFRRQFPNARWHVHDPVAGREGEVLSERREFHYDLSAAKAIVSLGSDFLIREPGSVRYARQFADGRRVRARDGQLGMNRLYVAESTLSVTGSMADHRLPVNPEQLEAIASALAQRLGVSVAQPPNGELSSVQRRWVEAVAADLSKGGVVIAGRTQSPFAQAVALMINQKLGNTGRSVRFTEPVLIGGGSSLSSLVDDMQSGRVDTLLILGCNPAYTAPADVPFAEALQQMSQVKRGGGLAHFTAHLAMHFDETSFRCQWHVNEAHWLESWGDVRAFDGAVSIIQPLIAPMYDGKTVWEMMDYVLGRTDRTGLEILRAHWIAQKPAGDFEQWWLKTLQKGVADKTSLPLSEPPKIRDEAMRPGKSTGGDTVIFEPDPGLWDGRFANNAWLQELPRPFTKLTWDNAILVGMRTAERLGAKGRALRDGDVVRVTCGGREIQGPVALVPGQADDVVTVLLGYGRRRGGEVMLQDRQPRGYDAYRLRTRDALWQAGGAQIIFTGRSTILAITRNHHAMQEAAGVPGIKPQLRPESIAKPGDSDADLELRNRKLVRVVSLPQFKANDKIVHDLDPDERQPLLSLYPQWDYSTGHQWAMSIDMTACIGCNACVVACQAENNIPVVGKDLVIRQREMHWIRIDDYFSGPLDSPSITHQPVPCMHCENAPCEYVCPVGATTHSSEGINEMTYNRCIGTRYCSNNCPYKVRRFNFFLYHENDSESLRLGRNPDVTVRSRGVMEKCNYCIQRINGTRAEMEKRELKLGPGEDKDRVLRGILDNLQTACQQACPTRAIVFGDLNSRGSAVAKLKREPTDYVLLRSLTTKPRTSYMARITNPNPALAEGGQA